MPGHWLALAAYRVGIAAWRLRRDRSVQRLQAWSPYGLGTPQYLTLLNVRAAPAPRSACAPARCAPGRGRGGLCAAGWCAGSVCHTRCRAPASRRGPCATAGTLQHSSSHTSLGQLVKYVSASMLCHNYKVDSFRGTLGTHAVKLLHAQHVAKACSGCVQQTKSLERLWRLYVVADIHARGYMHMHAAHFKTRVLCASVQQCTGLPAELQQKAGATAGGDLQKLHV